MIGSALTLDRVSAGYHRDRPVVSGVSLQFASGTVSTILGPNGAGKSTLLGTIAGAVRLFDGAIRFGPDDISGYSVVRRVRTGIALCAQGRNNFPRLSVQDNLQVAARGGWDDAGERIDSLSTTFPVLREKWKALAGSLSGGQQQVLELAMCLMSDPKILLIDEPSMGLSPNHFRPVLLGIQEVAAMGKTVIMVEQNVKAGLSISDNGIVLKRGQVVAVEPAAVLSSDDELRRHLVGNH